MKKTCKTDLLPLGTLLLAALSGWLRYTLYQVGLDEKMLLVAGHPLELAVWLCMALTAAVICFGALRQKQTGSPSPLLSAFGHILGASGILLTVLLNGNSASFAFAVLWKYCGIAAAAGLVYGAFAVVLGKRPFFAAYAIPSIFFALHLISHYKFWCSDPQLQNYVFAFLGTVALMLFAYQCSAAIFHQGKPQSLRLWGLLAAYFCLVCISGTEYLFLYLGCGLWALSCTFCPKKEVATDAAS